MKKFKIIIFAIVVSFIGACTIEEDNPNLSKEDAFVSLDSYKRSLDGIYSNIIDWGYMGNQYYFITNLGSGFGWSKRGGNRNTSFDNLTLSSLKPSNSSTYVENTWIQMYSTISKSNDIIAYAPPVEAATSSEDIGINSIIGEAYFLRAYNYFNLVRLWGQVPLRIEPTASSAIYQQKAAEKEIYDQIIKDANQASLLMSETPIKGYPAKYAADMLLAKVYMTLATADTSLQDSSLNYWQLAYDHAINVYGKYQLLTNYSDLFNEDSNDANSESIFELQVAIGASTDHVRSFTASNYTKANTFGNIRINADVYDLHNATYPGDERIAATFLTNYTQQHNGKTYNSYPNVTNRTNWNGFPYLYKLGSKDPANMIREGNQNVIIYRYADLLIMLAEISNELQNGEALGYVQEVLNRVGITTPLAAYTGGDQAAFRNAIMKEYQFELLMEGHDWFNNRRRGYDYFLNNVIIPHNTSASFKAAIDVTHETSEAIVMKLPIPASEINYNEEIAN